METEKKAEKLIKENRVYIQYTTKKRVYYYVIGFTEYYTVICDKLRDEWSCDCKFFTIKQKECSHIKACKLFRTPDRITIKHDGSIWVGDRKTGHRVIINGELCYVSPRNKYHFVRKYNGFAITKKLFDFLYEEGYKKIIIDYKCVDGKREIYEVDMLEMYLKGINDKLDGFEPQLFLPLEDWKKHEKM